MLSQRSGWSVFPYVLIGVSSWLAYKILIKPFLSPLRKVPGRPYKPIIGNMFEALKEEAMTNTIRWMKDLNSRLIRFYYLYGEERLLTADPAVVKYICVTNSKNYRHSNASGMIKRLTPDFLLVMNGEAHHSLKVLLNPAFNTHSVNGFIPVFDKKTEEVVEQWTERISSCAEDCVIPGQSYMAYITLDAICECGFEYQLGSIRDPQSPAVLALRKILEGFKVRLRDLLPLVSLIPTGEKRQQKEAIDFFTRTIMDVIKAKRHQINAGGDSHSGDLLSRLMTAQDEAGNTLNDDMIYSQVGGFLFAGFETTSTGLTWTLLMLAQHQDAQEKARQEVMSLLSGQQPITAEMVQQLTYLTCVIKETLRLFPPVTNHFRQAISDDVIQGYYIPAGTKIGISSGALHRLPENWEDPESFKPERFLQDYDPYSYLPFSAGPFMCIGHAFAMTEMKTVLARLLANFRFKLPPGYKYRRIRQLTLQPSPPLSLIVSAL
ncbi:uncharacterized protein [Littorina saxatilis]|uniref:Cytochrome P450 n=1 Tax=Littorina saxatilis TaxID=31220 RepID=A0AAN9G3Y9_9CAEN